MTSAWTMCLGFQARVRIYTMGAYVKAGILLDYLGIVRKSLMSTKGPRDGVIPVRTHEHNTQLISINCLSLLLTVFTVEF